MLLKGKKWQKTVLYDNKYKNMEQPMAVKRCKEDWERGPVGKRICHSSTSLIPETFEVKEKNDSQGFLLISSTVNK